MASSRRLPTTPNTSSYDSGGGKDYATLQGWEEATDIDLTAGGQSAGEILECYKGIHDDFDVLDGATTDSSYFRVIKPASGEGHLDVNPGIPAVDGSMAAFVPTTSPAQALRITEANSQFHDLIGKLNLNNATSTKMFAPRGSNSVVAGCIAVDGLNIGAGDASGFQMVGGGIAVDCITINNDLDGFVVAGDGYAYNCSAVNNGGHGFNNGGAMIAKNCLSDNNTGNDYNNNPTMTTCGSSDATGSAGLQSQSYTFVNAGADDFHYTSGSDGIGDGTDLSGDGIYAFDDDIDEDTRSAWDLGFDEFVAAAAGIVPILDHHYRMMRNQ